MWVIHFYASCQNYTSRDHIESRCKGLMLLYACLLKNKYKNLFWYLVIWKKALNRLKTKIYLNNKQRGIDVVINYESAQFEIDIILTEQSVRVQLLSGSDATVKPLLRALLTSWR